MLGTVRNVYLYVLFDTFSCVYMYLTIVVLTLAVSTLTRTPWSASLDAKVSTSPCFMGMGRVSSATKSTLVCPLLVIVFTTTKTQSKRCVFYYICVPYVNKIRKTCVCIHVLVMMFGSSVFFRSSSVLVLVFWKAKEVGKTTRLMMVMLCMVLVVLGMVLVVFTMMLGVVFVVV